METTASIIAVVQLCEKVIKYIIAVSGAKDEKARLRSKIRGCSSLLLQLQDEAADSEEVEEWSKTLKILATPLARLHEALSLTAVALSSRDGVGEKLRWPFKEKDVGRLVEAIDGEMALVSLALHANTTQLLIEINARSKRNEHDLRELKDVLESDMGTTVSTLQNLSRELQTVQITQNGVRGRIDSLHERHDTKEVAEKRQNILDWLTPVDHASQQRDAISRRQAGTGGWLLQSQAYQDWLSTSNRTLFCPGIPGAGKTVSASIINADLWERYCSDATVGLAHLFCNYRRQDEQTSDALLSGLLRQLLEPQALLPKHVVELYEDRKKCSSRTDAMTRALQQVAASYSRVFIVIDALDECSASHGCRTALLSKVRDLQRTCGINLLATSRFIPEITEKFKAASMLEIQADSSDVRKYLSENICRLPGFVRNNTELQEQIISKVVEAVRGMFLLAKLHLDSLIGKRSTKAVRLALDRLATGSDAYDSAYDTAMERIKGQLPEQTELAKQALAFLTCAQRPFSTLELQMAMGVEVGELELDSDNYPDIDDILASCLGLVTVDEDSGIIRLVHYTTQEYLERTLDRWFPEAEAMITDICLSYLCLNCYADPAHLDPAQDSAWYKYAATHWVHHAHRAPSRLERVIDFLTQTIPLMKASLYSGCWHHDRKRTYLRFGNNKEPWTTGLHIAALIGLEKATVVLLQRGYDTSQTDAYGRAPLHVATEAGNKTIVELLLTHGSSIDARIDDCDRGDTALHVASGRGYADLVKILLDNGAAINSQNLAQETPLSRAVLDGRTEAVRVLLEAKADTRSPDSRYNNPNTLLSRAVRWSNTDLIQLLVAAGVDVDERDARLGMTALCYTALYPVGIDCIRMLLEAGADPNLYSHRYANRSPLMMTCSKHEEGSISKVKMLVDAGANIDYVNSEGMTAYEFAKQRNSPDVAEYLLDRGANPELGLNGQPNLPHDQW